MSALALCFVVASATAQTSQLEFTPGKVPAGTAFHYLKSNLDGSHPTRISLYIVDRDRLESFKRYGRGGSATLVQARMDWRRWSVSKLDVWQLRKGLPPQLRATLEANADGTEVNASFAPNRPVKIDRWPWHSYDFDFASLGMTLPHLKNPQADLIFWRNDVVFAGESKRFAPLGGIRLHFEALDRRQGRAVRRYLIGGAGIGHLYGKLWTDAATGWLIEYELPIGDEPGYTNVHLLLERTEPMTVARWEAFKNTQLGQ